MTLFGLYIVNEVLYVMRINDAIQLAWQAQYLFKLEGASCCSAHCKCRFTCHADQSRTFISSNVTKGANVGSSECVSHARFDQQKGVIAQIGARGRIPMMFWPHFNSCQTLPQSRSLSESDIDDQVK